MFRAALKIAALFFSISVAHSAAPVPMTWEQCAQEAVKGNPDVLAAQQAVDNARAQRRGSYAGFLPQLSANAGYSQNLNSINNLIQTTPNNIYSATVSATQTVFSGLKDVGKVEQASANERSAEAALQTALAKLHYDLKSAFASVIYNQQLIRLTEKIAERRDSNLKLVKLRFEGGAENKGSFLLSQASSDQARFEIAQAKRALDVSENNLAQLLGRSGEPVTAQGELVTLPVSHASDFEAMVKTTPDHKDADAKWEAAQAESRIANAAFFPEVSINGSIGRQGDTFFPQNDRWSIGVSVSFPFFNGAANIFNASAASANEIKAEYTRRGVDLKTALRLRTLYNALADSIGERDVAISFLKAADARAVIARGKYTTGLMTFENWDIIESDLITREKRALQLKQDAVVAEVAWLQAQGKGPL